ncbi:tarag [Haematobia irritans]|uniref:tarag n=1 Tax=Haematobia irritans TaxID=7368 RepID=UPI003F5097F5
MGDSLPPSTKDAATETSHADIFESTITISTISNESQDTLRDVRRTDRPSYREVAIETDFPIVTSLTISITTTDIYVDRSSEIVEERDKGDSLVRDTSSPSSDSLDLDTLVQQKFSLKSSKSHHVRKFKSPIDEDDHGPTMIASKSHYVKQYRSSSDEDSHGKTNLEKGNVFVYMVLPPDGGYGWFIMFISFCCQIVVDGIIFGIGVILPHIAQEFHMPGSKVVLIASMQVGFYFLSGTLSSAFINKFGFRPVAMTGCLISITVLTVATFSTNLPMMIIFYSILGGPGLSMIWVSSQLIIGYYFEKYRPIANGLSCSGAGVGIMIFAYMNNVLVRRLGWRYLMRLHVGFLLLVFLMVLTYVEVAPTRVGRMKEITWDDSESDDEDIIEEMTRYSRYTMKNDMDFYDLDEDFERVMENMEKPSDAAETQPQDYCSKCFHSCCPCLQSYVEKRKEAQAQEAKHYVIRQDLMERPDLFYMGHHEESNEMRTPSSEGRKTVSFGDMDMRTISFDDSDERINSRRLINTLSTIAARRSSVDHGKSNRELQKSQRYPLLSFLRPENCIHPKIRRGFNQLFDFRLLAIKEFRLLWLSAFLFPMGFNIPFVYSTVRVQIEPGLAKLISPSIGFSNFAFRIASGFVAYKFRQHTTYICGGGMVFGGVAVLVSAFYGLDVVWFQFLYAICYGIAPAFYSTLRAIIYVRSLGLDKLTNAFGLTALAMGMGVFIGTTAGGILNDLTGDYTASFAFAGICIIVAGSLKLLLPHLGSSQAEVGPVKK